MTDDVRKLLGGYATGTLTEEEKQTLFEAALEDPALFSALADEQALKELLDDPRARAQVLQAAENQVFSIAGLMREWFSRTRSKALVATFGVLMVAIAVTTYRDQRRMEVARVTQVSEPQIVAAPPASPPPQPAEERAAPVSRPRAKPAKISPGSKKNQASDALAEPKREAEVAQAAKEATRAEPVLISAAPPVAPQAGPPVISAFLDRQPALSVASGSAQIKYVLLKRSASGEYQPVAADAEFAADEEARLAVEVNEAGVIAVARDDSKSITSTVVQPGQPATFSLPAATRTATVSFTATGDRPVGSTLVPSADTRLGARAATERAKQGPSAFSRAQSDKQLSTAPTTAKVEIKLNRKLN
jgi:hypothetical protein